MSTPANIILDALRDMCEAEDVGYDDDSLRAIVIRNDGDIRAASQELSSLLEIKGQLEEGDIATSAREGGIGIFELLDGIFKEDHPKDVVSDAIDVDETPRDLLHWIEDNVPEVYDAEELANAYEFLARGDVWLGRAQKTQDYSLWRNANTNIIAGVAASRDRDRSGWTKYGPPSQFRKMGQAKKFNNTREVICQRIAEESGMSIGSARQDVIPYLEVMTKHCKNRELTLAVAARYKLNEKQISWLTGSGETTNKVQSIVEEAEEINDVEVEEVESVRVEEEEDEEEESKKEGSMDAFL